MPASLSSAKPNASSALLTLVEDTCPLCEQQIPHERHDEIMERIAVRNRAQEAEVDKRIELRVAAERTAVQEAGRQETAKQVASARDEAKREAEEAAASRIAGIEQAGAAMKQDLETKLATAVAETAKVRDESAVREEDIKQQAMADAQAAMSDKFDAMQAANAEAMQTLRDAAAASEAGKRLSDGTVTELREALEVQRQDTATQIANLNEQWTQRETAIRADATAAAQAAATDQLAQSESQRAALQQQVDATEQSIARQKEEFDTRLMALLSEQREALEQAGVDALNKEKSKAFEENLKLNNKLEEAQRIINKMTAEELGESAEIDLYEDLRRAFEGDKIERVNKGQPGADIIHTVMHNGQACGQIIYDSKNHRAWRNDFVTKLASDKLAQGAGHAILSSRKLPEGARHVAIQDGIIVATPARVVTLAQMVRLHIIEVHTMRVGNAQRAEKTEALYDFMTGKLCADLFEQVDQQAEALLDLQTREMAAHKRTWDEQGRRLRLVMKTSADLLSKINAIIGTAAPEGAA
jgi:hypothetical protein